LGHLACEIVEINKKLCSLEFLVLLVQAKRTEKKVVPKVLVGCETHCVASTTDLLFKMAAIKSLKRAADSFVIRNFRRNGQIGWFF
jgi:hypothetical protein